MRLAVFAVLAVLVVISAPDAEPNHHQIGSLVTTCDNDGRCNTFKKNVDTDVAHRSHYRPVLTEAAKDGPRATAIDANGNTAGLVISHKTGARARVGVAYAARFQAYIDDLENNHGFWLWPLPMELQHTLSSLVSFGWGLKSSIVNGCHATQLPATDCPATLSILCSLVRFNSCTLHLQPPAGQRLIGWD